jgi:hypothetical protein
MSADLIPVPVPGADLPMQAAQIEGRAFVAFRPLCDSLGVDPDSQAKKLRARSWATTVLTAVVAADGRTRDMLMVDRRTLTMWLATLDERRIGEAARARVIAYQAQAADALDAYFHEGGTLNPHATEDQLERLSRQAQAQAAVLTALKGVVDPKHLEAKGRLILARALGEAPELDKASLPLYVSDYLAAKGLSKTLVAAKASGFGKRLKARYIVEHDCEPQRHHQELPNGTVREVYAYTESDRPLFESVWARHYANVVAESALKVLPGGAS